MSAIPLSRASSGLAGAYARPSTSIVPASGLIRPASTFIKVLLPAPFSPISACTSPFCKRRLTPSSATVGPKRLLILESERTVIDFVVETFSLARRSVVGTFSLAQAFTPGEAENPDCFLSLLQEVSINCLQANHLPRIQISLTNQTESRGDDVLAVNARAREKPHIMIQA